jgi:hypothetical protein
MEKEQQAAIMKCEICNAIERLGLDPSAHDLWYCSEPAETDSGRRAHAKLETILLKAATLHRAACDLLAQGCKHLVGYGVQSRPAYRRHYITLGL